MASYGRVPHSLGAVIVRGGTVLAVGANNYDKGLHAEVASILKCKSNLRGADIYVARYLRSKVCGLAKPCPVCENLIRKVGIKRVFYTTSDPKNPIAMFKVSQNLPVKHSRASPPIVH